MTFDIDDYMYSLEASLAKLAPPYRMAFAAWCASALLVETCDYLACSIGKRQVQILNEALDYVWECSLIGIPAKKSEVSKLESSCDAITWPDEALENENDRMKFYAIEAISSVIHALDTCRTGSTRSAAMAAQRAINKLDYELAQEYGKSYTEKIFCDPRMRRELDRQQKMVAYLQKTDCLRPEDKTRFRSES